MTQGRRAAAVPGARRLAAMAVDARVPARMHAGAHAAQHRAASCGSAPTAARCCSSCGATSASTTTSARRASCTSTRARAELDGRRGPAAQMRALGCDRRLITVDEALAIEPALRHIAPRLAGATYTAQDESGDANRFARELVEHCQADGVRFLMSHTVTALRAAAGKLDHVEATDAEGRFQFLRADAYVLALGSWSPLYVRPLGIAAADLSRQGLLGDDAGARRVARIPGLADRRRAQDRVLATRRQAAHCRHGRAQRLRPRLEPRALRGDRAAHRGAIPRRRRHGAGAVLDRPAPGDAVATCRSSAARSCRISTSTPATARSAGRMRAARARASRASSAV